jgi:hypothetical protein
MHLVRDLAASRSRSPNSRYMAIAPWSTPLAQSRSARARCRLGWPTSPRMTVGFGSAVRRSFSQGSLRSAKSLLPSVGPFDHAQRPGAGSASGAAARRSRQRTRSSIAGELFLRGPRSAAPVATPQFDPAARRANWALPQFVADSVPRQCSSPLRMAALLLTLPERRSRPCISRSWAATARASRYSLTVPLKTRLAANRRRLAAARGLASAVAERFAGWRPDSVPVLVIIYRLLRLVDDGHFFVDAVNLVAVVDVDLPRRSFAWPLSSCDKTHWRPASDACDQSRPHSHRVARSHSGTPSLDRIATGVAPRGAPGRGRRCPAQVELFQHLVELQKRVMAIGWHGPPFG